MEQNGVQSMCCSCSSCIADVAWSWTAIMQPHANLLCWVLTASKQPVSEAWRPFHLNFVCAEGSIAGNILGSISYGHTRGYGEEIWEPGKTVNGCTACLPCIPQLHATRVYQLCTCVWQINKAEAKNVTTCCLTQTGCHKGLSSNHRIGLPARKEAALADLEAWPHMPFTFASHWKHTAQVSAMLLARICTLRYQELTLKMVA